MAPTVGCNMYGGLMNAGIWVSCRLTQTKSISVARQKPGESNRISGTLFELMVYVTENSLPVETWIGVNALIVSWSFVPIS